MVIIRLLSIIIIKIIKDQIYLFITIIVIILKFKIINLIVVIVNSFFQEIT